jgi:hypothetical protein
LIDAGNVGGGLVVWWFGEDGNKNKAVADLV